MVDTGWSGANAVPQVRTRHFIVLAVVINLIELRPLLLSENTSGLPMIFTSPDGNAK
jgi:hypothetical protein